MREDNRGVTLIELIIAVAISVIFSGVVLGFVGSTVKNYRYTSAGVKTQMESQRILDHVRNMSMEVGSYVSYSASGSRGTFTVGGTELKKIIWEKPKLYYQVDSGEKELLGSHVTYFSVNTSRVRSERLLKVSLTVEMSGRKVEKKESINLRNSGIEVR